MRTPQNKAEIFQNLELHKKIDSKIVSHHVTNYVTPTLNPFPPHDIIWRLYITSSTDFLLKNHWKYLVHGSVALENSVKIKKFHFFQIFLKFLPKQAIHVANENTLFWQKLRKILKKKKFFYFDQIFKSHRPMNMIFSMVFEQEMSWWRHIKSSYGVMRGIWVKKFFG